jgi:NAD(P)-dependent dehydrogenase (short-subunit alcohol dehydrogenase family)
MSKDQELDFDGRVAIVTGAGSGMGREYAVMLAAREARVVVNDFSPESAAETVRIITDAGGTAAADTNDVVSGAPDLIQNAVDTFGGLDVVINNAGTVGFGRFWEMDEGDWWRLFDIHVRGTVRVSRLAMPHLIASGTGRLINTSSSSMLGAAGCSAYGAAKAAIWGYGNTITAEAREVGVQVTTIQPSAWTPMTEFAFDNPAIVKVLREQLPASAAAAFVTWLAHQDTTVYGECFQVSGISAGRTAFGAMPRIRVQNATPEDWATSSDALTRDADLTPLRSTGESFRAELVFLDPSMEDEIPLNPADVS